MSEQQQLKEGGCLCVIEGGCDLLRWRAQMLLHTVPTTSPRPPQEETDQQQAQQHCWQTALRALTVLSDETMRGEEGADTTSAAVATSSAATIERLSASERRRTQEWARSLGRRCGRSAATGFRWSSTLSAEVSVRMFVVAGVLRASFSTLPVILPILTCTLLPVYSAPYCVRACFLALTPLTH
jgi:hypothetical protein